MSVTDLATPFYDDGDEITGFCTANVLGKTFVGISGPRQAGGPNLNPMTGITDATVGGNVSIATAAAGGKVFGVAAYDQTSGNLVQCWRGNKVVPVTAGAALTAGTEVQSDGSGHAIAWTTGIKAGLCLDAAASGADAQIALYP